jgi:hypothetical protein
MSEISQVHKNADPHLCSKALSKLLVGAWVIRFEYYRTGWEVVFSLPESSRAVAAGLVLHPHEVALSAEAGEALELNGRLARTLVLSTMHTVQAIEVDSASNLTMTFTNGTSVFFPGTSGPVDEVWCVYKAPDSGRKRCFGEPSFLQSYFGQLSIDPEFAAFGAAP